MSVSSVEGPSKNCQPSTITKGYTQEKNPSDAKSVVCILCPRLRGWIGLEGGELGGSRGCQGRLWDRFLWQVYTPSKALCLLYRSGRPVIIIGPKCALGSHAISPIHSAPSLGQSIVSHFEENQTEVALTFAKNYNFFENFFCREEFSSKSIVYSTSADSHRGFAIPMYSVSQKISVQGKQHWGLSCLGNFTCFSNIYTLCIIPLSLLEFFLVNDMVQTSKSTALNSQLIYRRTSTVEIWKIVWQK